MPPLINKKGNRKRMQERLRLVTARHKIYLWQTDTIEPISAFGFVSDFSEDGVGVYVLNKMRLQAPVRVAFEDPKAVTYRGSVIWTARIGLQQGFHGHEAVKYRMGIKFLFGTEAERQRYMAYYADVLRRVQEVNLGI